MVIGNVLPILTQLLFGYLLTVRSLKRLVTLAVLDVSVLLLRKLLTADRFFGVSKKSFFLLLIGCINRCVLSDWMAVWCGYSWL